MFFLQIVGKALVLDEIINYVLSLQHQVEVTVFYELCLRLFLLLDVFVLARGTLTLHFHWLLVPFNEAGSCKFKQSIKSHDAARKRCKLPVLCVTSQ